MTTQCNPTRQMRWIFHYSSICVVRATRRKCASIATIRVMCALTLHGIDTHAKKFNLVWTQRKWMSSRGAGRWMCSSVQAKLRCSFIFSKHIKVGLISSSNSQQEKQANKKRQHFLPTAQVSWFTSATAFGTARSASTNSATRSSAAVARGNTARPAGRSRPARVQRVKTKRIDQSAWKRPAGVKKKKKRKTDYRKRSDAWKHTAALPWCTCSHGRRQNSGPAAARRGQPLHHCDALASHRSRCALQAAGRLKKKGQVTHWRVMFL